MNTTNRLTKIIDSKFTFLVDDYGFQRHEEDYRPDVFGSSSIVLESDELMIRLVFDGRDDNISLEIKSPKTKDAGQPNLEEAGWFDAEMVRAIIAGSNFAVSAKNWDELAEFLKQNYLKIVDLFSPENLSTTTKKLEGVVWK